MDRVMHLKDALLPEGIEAFDGGVSSRLSLRNKNHTVARLEFQAKIKTMDSAGYFWPD